MIGQTLGHYRIVEKIGEGGMGQVYRAYDDRLDRAVALKILPAGTLADEAARKRFRKEAQALAKLNHPNIGTVHDFDSQDGVDFLVMEFIPGDTLTQKLGAGSLPEKETVALAAQIAAALEEAHEHGVIHRDLKPGNVLVTPKGQAKVLDFGLAKLLHPSGDSAATQTFTETQAVAGTLPYMSPEQLRGEPTDARSDIWALGAVIYEMATGQRPFPETHGPRLIDAILHQTPQPPSTVNRRISSALDSVILKALDKEPENRYQSAKEVAVDLRRLGAPSTVATVPARAPARPRWQLPALAASSVAALLVVVVAFNVGGWRARLLGRPASPHIESLAVLPLENLSRDPEQEYFADGMTEALITELSKIGALKVISRTSVMQYKGAKKPLPQIAQQLGVDGVIEGSVLREGDQVRITVQLIHGRSDQHLWADSYQRELRSILGLQAEVARAIAQEIRVKLTPQEQTRLAAARPVNRDAYEAYLKGRYYSNQRTQEGLKKGIEYLQNAITLDPNYALAYTELANSYAELGGVLGFVSPRDFYPKAKAATLKALEIDPTLGEAHASLGGIKLKYEWDWAAAEREYKRALELNPSYAPAHQDYGSYLEALSRFDEAVAERKRAQELDPLSPIRTADVGYPLYYAGQYDQAIEHYRRALELDPSFSWAYLWIGQAYVQKGMCEEAIAAIKKSIALSAGNTRAVTTLGHAYALCGRRAQAQGVLKELTAQSKQRYVSPYFIALVYAGLEEKNRMFEWLERAYEERHPYLVLLKVEPVFASVRSDPRFQDLLRRIGLPP